MEIEGGIDPYSPLDYVELQIFPSKNRYEVYVCSRNKAVKAASGTLKQLLLHSPQVKNLSSKGSNTNFKILPPDNVNDAEWFTTATLTRFLRVLGSPDILSIGNEITQLEETRKFQLSLALKAVVDVTSSIDSKNELLKAVDLRLTALKDEVIAAFDQLTGAICSIKDISDLESFAHHFGAKDIRDLLQKFVEMNVFPTVEDYKKIIEYENVGQTKQHNSTNNEISSFSSEDDQPSVDRCRSVKRSATPRRSSSPMRRIQIGRSGSHRAPALTIKSLNHFPSKEKISFQKCLTVDSSDEDDNDPDKPAKKNVLRMSVQDKISLFESKQRDQKMEVLKTKKLFVGPNKVVLRRWSSGMGENATQKPHPEPEPKPTPDPEPEPESDGYVFKSRVSNVAAENIKPYSPEREERFENHPDAIEWSQQNEAKLNELFMKMMENKNKNKTKTVRRQNPKSDITKSKKNTVMKEDRGGSYDQNMQIKIQVEASGKKVEKTEKIQKNLSPLMNSKKEPLKPSVLKKPVSKPSSLPVTRKSWSSTPSPKTPTGSSRKPVGSNTKSEKMQQPWSTSLKSTPKSTSPDTNRNLKSFKKLKSTTITKTTKTKVDQTPEVKPSFYNKVTKKSSVVPLETKPFLRKGSGIGPGVGPVVIKSKVVDQPDEASRTSGTSEVNEVVMANDVSEIEEKCEPQVVSPSPSLSPSPSPIPSPIKCEEQLSSNVKHKEVEAEVDNDHDEEMIPSLVQSESPVQVVVPDGISSSPRVRHSLSEMLLEESNEEADVLSEWGNAEQPPLLVYQKDSPKGFKRLLKFARKSKAESASSEVDDDVRDSKGTKSFFSLSAFRASKTTESKLPQH